MMTKLWRLLTGASSTPTPTEPKLRVGAIRIVPVGKDGFGVERYSFKDAKRSRCPATWERIHGHTIGESLEMCEHIARETLLAQAAEAEAIRLDNEARMAHHQANPPRIITLDNGQ